MKKLTQLDLSENKIEYIPDEIGTLTNLTDLILSQNQIEQLPDTIGWFSLSVCAMSGYSDEFKR